MENALAGYDAPVARYVDVNRVERPMPRWQDASGNWWTPGEVTPSGHIVSKPGTFLTAGVVYIEAAQLEAAKAAGWEQVDDIAPNGLTKVERRCPGF